MRAGLIKLFWFMLLTMVAILPANAVVIAPQVSVGLGFEFTSGDYGTATTTNSVYAPLMIDVSTAGGWGVSLDIPYVYQSNTNVIAGQFHQMQGSQSGMQRTIAAMGSGGSSRGGGSLRSASNTDPSKPQSGLGDIALRVGYVLIQETDLVPQVKPVVSVKFPTADRDRGLGTGEFDEGASVEISKWFGDWYTYLEPGYMFQGESADLPLKDYVSCSGGVGYQVTENLQSLAILKGSSALAEGSSSLLEARLKLKYQTTLHTGIEGYLAKGIASSSPDFGAGVAVFYNF
mgnify:CR=1 FL=1